MPLSVGDRLGPYEILAPIGAGGMGEVWKARDTRLDRIVAIKTSQAKFSERFEREARAVAALNHPHICALYDVGPDYLVMEYVEGKPLSGPLPIAQALEYAAQICDALGDAHRKGIVHRDLKPGNILVGKNGVKILDFGLAKIDPKQVPGQATATIPLTEEGTVLGTLQYMSPEQLEGQEADARSDIFALGLVLYEMISGKRPFTGKTRTSLVASILKDQPQPLRALDPLTPAAVDRVIATCLEKDPDKRWQSARDVGSALDLVSQVAPLPSAPARAPSRSRLALAGWMVAAIVLLAAGLGAWRFWPKPAPPARVVRFEVPLPDKVTSSQYVTVSPDGQKLVLDAANSGLWIRNLASLEWRLLPETQGAGLPFWSPDSRFLGFAAGSELKKIDVTGGPPQTLCELAGQTVRTGAWGADGTIVFNGGNGPLWRVPETGGIPTAVTSLDAAHGESVHADPSFLPDGKHFLYLRFGRGGGLGVYLGSLDAKPAEQSKQRFLASQRAAYYADGYVFFMRENTLMAQPFDTAKFQLKGDPVPVAEHVATSTTVGFFSVSASGVLAYREGAQNVNSQLTWFDRQGKAVETSGQPAPFFGIQLSPDGKRAAGRDALQQATGDIWTLDLARGVRTRLTFRQSLGSYPVWSPDGSRIAFAAGSTLDTLFEKDSSGAGAEKGLYQKAGEIKIPASWSRDGRFLLYSTVSAPKTRTDLWVLPLEGDHEPVLLLGTEFNEGGGAFSPDMRWIAYVSDESGQSEVYVRPFLASGPSGKPALGEGKWQVSRDGATPDTPRWRADGKELFFLALNNSAVMAVDVNGNGPAFQMGTPQQLFSVPLNNAGVDVTADGKRFLLAAPPGSQNVSAPITVILNWPALLKR